MKFEAEINKAENMGDAADITLTNVDRIGSAAWRGYGPNVTIRVPFSKLKNYTIKIIIQKSLMQKLFGQKDLK